MKSVHFGEHLVNTLVNTFLREVNTFDSLRVYTRFVCVIYNIYRYVNYSLLPITTSNTCVYVFKVRKVFTTRSKVFTKAFTNCSPNHSFLEDSCLN